MALGADRKEVFGLIMRQGARLAVIGGGLGMLGAVLAGRGLTSLLFAVSPLDPLTFAMVLVVCLGCSLVACYLPARRAAAVDPARAMRTEP
jgi:putative ABC transport system permease protein